MDDGGAAAGGTFVVFSGEEEIGNGKHEICNAVNQTSWVGGYQTFHAARVRLGAKELAVEREGCGKFYF